MPDRKPGTDGQREETFGRGDAEAPEPVRLERLRPVPRRAERPLVAAPLYHMNALAVCQAALVQHDTIILLPGFTVSSYVEAASRHRATVLTSVPTMIAMMLRE